MCNKCYPNSEGLWCWKHPIEVTDRDCLRCKGIVLFDDYRPKKNNIEKLIYKIAEVNT